MDRPPSSPTILGFCQALRDQWIALMSGGIGVILGVVALYVSGETSKAVFWALAVIGVGIAGYLLWRQERLELIILAHRIQSIEDEASFALHLEGISQVNHVDSGTNTRTELVYDFHLHNTCAKPIRYSVISIHIDGIQLSPGANDGIVVPPNARTLHTTGQIKTTPIPSNGVDRHTVLIDLVVGLAAGKPTRRITKDITVIATQDVEIRWLYNIDEERPHVSTA